MDVQTVSRALNEFVRVVHKRAIRAHLADALTRLQQLTANPSDPATRDAVELSRQRLLEAMRAEHALPEAQRATFEKVANNFLGSRAAARIEAMYGIAAGSPPDVMRALARVSEDLEAQLNSISQLGQLLGGHSRPEPASGDDIVTIRFAHGAEFHTLEELSQSAREWNDAFRVAHQLEGLSPGAATLTTIERGSWELGVTATSAAVGALVAIYGACLKRAETRAQIRKFEAEANKIDHELARSLNQQTVQLVEQRQLEGAVRELMQAYKGSLDTENETTQLLRRVIEKMSEFAVNGGRLLATSASSEEVQKELASHDPVIAKLDAAPAPPLLSSGERKEDDA